MNKKRIHIIPACGKLSAGIAIIANQLGYEVLCYDQNPMDPMLSQLQQHGLEVLTEFPNPREIQDDVVLLGNTMGRFHPWVEASMTAGVTFQSMPQWLYMNLLINRKVIVVSGTHGKTTTTSMVVYMMQSLGHDVGYLVGGQCASIGASAAVGDSEYFVIEGDEYDTAFFDKRAKLLWYWPYIALVNNLESDHMDIYPTIDDLYQTFRHWLRLVAPKGKIIIEETLRDKKLANEKQDVLFFNPRSAIIQHDSLYSTFTLKLDKEYQCSWSLVGEVYVYNLIAALNVIQSLGLSVSAAINSMSEYESVDRRMTCIFKHDNFTLFDDFAHHPTSIEKLLNLDFQQKKVIVVYPANFYMKSQAGVEATGRLIKKTQASVIWLHNKHAFYDVQSAQDILGDAFCVTYDDLIVKLKDKCHDHPIVITASSDYLPDLHELIRKSNIKTVA